MSKLQAPAQVQTRFNRIIHRLAVLLAAYIVVCTFAPTLSAQVAKKVEKTRSEERIERIEKGLAPIDFAKGQTKQLDLSGLMKLMNDPAVSVAVIDGYQIAWARAYGTTELGGHEAITTKTLFQAGSISKPVAAAGMLAL